MSAISASLTMITLDVLMIIYSLWVVSAFRSLGRLGIGIFLGMVAWLGVLHFCLANQLLFPADISGIVFLLLIFAGVGLVGAVLFLLPSIRRLILGLDQRQLLLLQGIRVFFGAAFLMQASLGVLPQAFGIVDGFTHIGVGFFGLIAAFSLSAGISGSRRAWFANLFGLADILIVASSLALLLLPHIGPHHSMMYAVFLPAPLWFWFHVVSIAKLLRSDEKTFQE